MIAALINSLKLQLSLFEQNIAQTNEPRNQQAQTQADIQYVSLEIELQSKKQLLPCQTNECFFLSQPDSHFSLLGLGTLIKLSTQGAQRFKHIKKAFSELKKQWLSVPNDNNPASSSRPSPYAFLNFAFDENDPMQGHWQGFANSQLIIPIVLIKQSHSSQTLIVNIKLDQTAYDATFATISKWLKIYFESQETLIEQQTTSITSAIQNQQQTWQHLAQHAINEIQAKKFDKIVASRCQTMQINHSVSPQKLVKKLIKHYPGCTIFSYQLKDKAIVSASPEKLVTLNYPEIQSDALGGTIFRHNKNSDKKNTLPFFLKPMEQQSQAELSESKKLLKEHHFISQTIYQSLDPLCHTLKMPVAPYLMKLHHLYHLETPIQGKLMPQYDIFDAIKALHPTPAVAGLPTRSAQQWLIKNEDYQRGWYTGAFGWLDGDSNGDIAVMLRCTLVHASLHRDRHKGSLLNETQLALFAGAGLVAESTPESEWLETELKMQTILAML